MPENRRYSVYLMIITFSKKREEQKYYVFVFQNCKFMDFPHAP